MIGNRPLGWVGRARVGVSRLHSHLRPDTRDRLPASHQSGPDSRRAKALLPRNLARSRRAKALGGSLRVRVS